jgi:hypothetical protein
VSAAIGTVDLGDIGFGEGAHLLLKHALARIRPGGQVAVTGSHPALTADVMAPYPRSSRRGRYTRA